MAGVLETALLVYYSTITVVLPRKIRYLLIILLSNNKKIIRIILIKKIYTFVKAFKLS